MARLSGRARLEQLLQARADEPARAAELEAAIHAEFGREVAVLVLDLSGYTRLTQRHGIVNFLTLVQRMRALARPEVAARGGCVFKTEADNLFARFDDVPAALAAARALLAAFARDNAGREAEAGLHGGVGIGYGPCLVIGDTDLHGNEMNLACKLGEDLARQGEILLTPAAHARAAVADARPVDFTIAGLELQAWSIAPIP